MRMYIYYNPNPKGRSTGDCVIRALSKAFHKPWKLVYWSLCIYGFMYGDMPSSNFIWGMYLKNNGFRKHIIPDTCPDCYTVLNFANDNSKGTFVLGTGDHVVTIIDGNYYDSWDSGAEVPIYYYSMR